MKHALLIIAMFFGYGCGYAVYSKRGIEDYCQICKAAGKIEYMSYQIKRWNGEKEKTK